MGRILSIDYGSKRTGVAVTDPLRIIANGLATVPTHELFDFLRQYMRQEQVDEVVIGRPTQPNGKPSENLRRVEEFVRRWRKAVPEVPITFFDERFTSVLAHQAILEGRREKEDAPREQGAGRSSLGHDHPPGLYARAGSISEISARVYSTFYILRTKK